MKFEFFLGTRRSPAAQGGKDSTSNYPLRGHKGSLYESGIRVPWAMLWPRVIEPGSDITMDILPKIFEAGGEKVDPECA
ncbi:MAG: hypothetical protein CBC31_002480 [Verrucomicrobia bacterium TMED71]|nr:MAG: hypothetical protein CBC31_002480 [Verrucomicrobia bacterium TMED71]